MARPDEDNHVHSTFSDGKGTIAENIAAAEAVGLKRLVCVDHVRLDTTYVPEFVAAPYLRDKQLEHILTDWRMPEGGLHFVTPTARARPAKVSALADFFVSRLATAEWRAGELNDAKASGRRKK